MIWNLGERFITKHHTYGTSVVDMKDRSIKQRELILRALTDPEFRKGLQDHDQAAKLLGIKSLSPENKSEIRFVLAAVRGISTTITALADTLLCANNGDPPVGRA